MKLHENKILFADIIARAAEHPSQGGLGIRPQFIEKDYWITNALKNLSESPYGNCAVFKGGTSLSKAYHIGMRLSENIDIPIIGKENLSDGKIETMISTTEKSMAKDLTEISHFPSSKGSRYRKAFFSYTSLQDSSQSITAFPGQLLIKINSFANPLPYRKMLIHSFIFDYLSMVMARDLIDEYGLNPFEINVLDKRTTMTEKLVSLVRFSLADNPVGELGAKIPHFYDLHYLNQDPECIEYLNSDDFRRNFKGLMKHNRELFDSSLGWRNKSISDSPLITDFKNLWKELRKRYEDELPAQVYSLTIPSADAIEESMKRILGKLRD